MGPKIELDSLAFEAGTVGACAKAKVAAKTNNKKEIVALFINVPPMKGIHRAGAQPLFDTV